MNNELALSLYYASRASFGSACKEEKHQASCGRGINAKSASIDRPLSTLRRGSCSHQNSSDGGGYSHPVATRWLEVFYGQGNAPWSRGRTAGDTGQLSNVGPRFSRVVPLPQISPLPPQSQRCRRDLDTVGLFVFLQHPTVTPY